MPRIDPATHISHPSQPLCIPHLLTRWSEQTPDALAVLAPGRPPLTYGQLQRHVDRTVQTLRALGIGCHDRVALVLPNGPELAAASLSVAAGATCAPLNPAYHAEEYAFHLTDLRIRALIVQADVDSPARVAADAQGIRVIELYPRREAEAGLFTLGGMAPQPAGVPSYAQPGDVALVMHTSGTTARPKIVPLTHTNICASAHHMWTALALDERDRYLSVMPLFHCAGLVLGLLASLMAGASVVCPPSFEACRFFAWLAAFRPTWYMGVSTIHQALLAQAPLYRETIERYPLRFIRAGAAALPPKVLADLESTFNVPVIEAYGMTETNVVTCNPLPPRPRKPGSVGVAAGPRVAVMNAEGVLLPAGEIGEVVVHGPNVMQGYENNPPANHEAFTHGWFRTGDQGFFDADGYLFITGRLKEIINRGGTKMSPQEVDDVLMQHPAVAQAATFAVPHVRWGEDVASAVVLRQHASVTAEDLRRFVVRRLAAFKVPSRVLVVDAIPLGPMGKLQRRSLAEHFGLVAPAEVRPALGAAYAAPRTPLEEVLTGLWARVLGVERVGIDDNFFQAGGDSLLATQLLAHIREATRVEVPFGRFFETPTVAATAQHIAAAHQAMPPVSEHPLRPVPRDHPLPLSYAQQRLWFLEQLGRTRHAYHLLEAVSLRGPLQVEALVESLREIVRRHEVLRTTFSTTRGQPFQVIGLTTPLSVSVVDLRGLPAGERRVRVHGLAQAAVQEPFDLARGPLLRASLVRLADAEHVLLLTMHHLVSDGWSHGVFWREFAALYGALTKGEPSPLPPLPIQYADFAVWQRQWRRGEVLDAQAAYWRQQLAGVPPLQLPTDHARPPVQTFRGARHGLTLPPGLTQALKELSRRHGVTLFMTLLAAFQALLHRYTGQDDVAVGTLTAGRNRAEVEPLIGFFVNVLVLRTDLSGDHSFRTLLARVREVALAAYGHQDVPYEKLLETLRPPRDPSRNPLFQALCVLHNTPQQAPELPGLTVHPLEIDPGTARFDVALEFWDTPEGLRGRFEYSTDLFEAATIARMAGHLQTVLEGAVADPEQPLSRLPLVTADERRRLLVEWNSTAAPYPDDQCIHGVFEAQAARTPDAVAVICGGERLTYDELNRRANRVAHYLQAVGVGPETLVGLCVERSLDMVVGLLGILKAGAAYLPLDPAYPPERLAFMLEDARPPVVLTRERLVANLPARAARVVCLDAQWPVIARYRDDNPASRAAADRVAYLLYTSGSTGSPKGVLGVHRATLNALAWMWRTFPLADGEVCCQKTSVSFGDSIQELFGPLLGGVRTVLIPDEVLKDLPCLVQTLALHRVTRLIMVPSLLRTLLDTCSDLPDRLPGLKLWFSGGEALATDLAQRFRERLPHARLINLYGASEASDDTTWYDSALAPSGLPHVPIGRPIANTQAYVLDQHLQPVPVGVRGELYVGGAGLTRGYLNRPGLTAERFVPHPFRHEPGARLYKTGDLVRYRPDGQIEYLGRYDQQVKLRGVRIELEEIEVVLRQHPAVREAAVILREDVPGEPRLVACIVPAREPWPTLRQLRRFLERKLPAAMLPAAFVVLAALPQTPSGKADRLALPAPSSLRPGLEDRYVPPGSPVERQLAAIWCELLGLEQVGIHDNFFELGGHSLLAMELLFRVHDATRVEVPLSDFFAAPTVARMAAIIEGANRTGQELQASPVVPVARDGKLPASIAQEHFWRFEQLLPGLPLFNIPYVLRLQGALNLEVLEHSCRELIRRHEALRTTFATVDGQLVQVIAPPSPMPPTVRDLGAWPEAERDGEAQRLLREESQRPFDLTQGPLMRVCVLRLDEREHLLLVTLHHIVGDGWSLGILLHELAVLYDALATGVPSPLPPLPIQYADFAFWQRRWPQHAEMRAQLAYWRAQLREPLPALALPTDRARGTAFQVHTARRPLEFPSTLVDALKERGQQEGSTLFMTCLAAFTMLLYGYTGQEDARVATLVANRTRRETRGVIGLFVNTVILRTDLAGNPTCREVLRRVRATTLAAFAHQDLPFEELVRTLEREQNLRRPSLCPVLLVWQNAMLRPLPLTARTLDCLPVEQHLVAPHVALTTFDVILTVREKPQGLGGTCLYKTDLFDEATIDGMLEDFRGVLACLSARPEQELSTFRALGGRRG